MTSETKLDQWQEAAAASTSDIIYVCACPGSGKTATTVERVRRMLARGVAPETICCVTFTCAGALEMQKRLGVRLGHCGTLHSLALKMLTKHHKLAGLPARVTVTDEQEAAASLAEIVTMLRFDGKISDKKLAEAVKSQRHAMAFAGAIESSSLTKEGVVAKEFFRRQQEAGELDYDSVLVYFLRLLKTGVEPWPFKHLLVDEAQDNAAIDWDIYDLMPVKTRWAVGDIDQSIYSFRGAKPVRFLSRIGEAQNSIAFGQAFQLPTNYRSGRAIVTASQRLIAHNTARVAMTAQPRPDAGDGMVQSKEFNAPVDELSWVANELSKLAPGDTAAVLWRTNRLADQCRQHFQSLGVKLAQPLAREPKEARAARAVLNFLASPWSDTAALRAAKAVGLDASTVHSQCDFQGQSPCVLLNGGMGAFDRDDGNPVAFTVDEFKEALRAVQVLSATGTDGIRDALHKLAASLPEPFTLTDLISAANSRDEPVAEQEGIIISTAHSAKGREWDIVIICGMEQETWPGRNAAEDLESERRLAYVATTRARSRLVVTWCKQRPAPGRAWLMQDMTPSQFISELGLTK